ncbi:MAG TPA: LmeA family phospholipid-binding protein [Candidatus Ozemobacteraceae bacterium]|nr:LmeA family phospholipid-binding protein [Candidatus Ozemobacteraceae bacterium]
MRNNIYYILSSCLLAVLGLLMGTATGWALEMTEGRVAAFQRDVMRALTELLPDASPVGQDGLVIETHDRFVRNIRLRSLNATIDGIDDQLHARLARREAQFEDLSRVRSVDVEIELDAADIRRFIDAELARQNAAHRALSGLRITFGAGRVQVSGTVDVAKIPGNPLSFIALGQAPFTAEASLRMEGDRLMVDIANATLNGVAFVPPLSTQVLDWLNPLIDFSALPQPAGVTKLEITPKGISLRGFLFSR